MMSMNLSDIAILNIKSTDYWCIISGISKNEAVNLILNADLAKKKGNIIKNKKFIFIYKNGKEILTFGAIEIEQNKFYRYKSLVPLRSLRECISTQQDFFWWKKL